MPLTTSGSEAAGWAPAGNETPRSANARTTLRTLRSTDAPLERDGGENTPPGPARQGGHEPRGPPSSMKTAGDGAGDEVHQLAGVDRLRIARRVVLRDLERHHPRRGYEGRHQIGDLGQGER